MVKVGTPSNKKQSKFLGSTTDAFSGSRGRCTKSVKLPQVMSLKSESVEVEYYEFENKKNPL